MRTRLARGIFLLVLAVTVGVFVGRTAQAAEEAVPGCPDGETCFTPNVPIPDLFPAKGKTTEIIDANIAGRYIRALYVYFVGIVGVLAVVMIMYAGFLWITAAGNSSKITEAKEHMNGAVIGVILALTSFLLLQLINPELVALRIPFIQSVDTIVQSSFFCSGNESTSGDDFKMLNGGGELECGKEYPVPDSASAESGRKPVMCMGDYCDRDSGSVCSPVAGSNSYDCMLPYFACEEEKPKGVPVSSWCPFIDRLIAASTSPKLKNIACRKQNTVWDGDKCKISDTLLRCPTNEIRVDCSDGATSEHPNTVCWDKNKPRTYDPVLLKLLVPGFSGIAHPFTAYRPTCQSLSVTRAAKGADAVCCRENASSTIRCGPSQGLFEIEVPCVQVGKPECTTKCWAEIQFRIGNGNATGLDILPIF